MLETPHQILEELERLRAENARLRASAGADANAELRLLRNIVLETSVAPNVDASLGALLRQVCEVTGWQLGQAWVPSSDGTSLECSPAFYARVKGIEKFRSFSEHFRFEPDIGLPGRVWSTKQLVSILDVPQDANFPRIHIATEAGLLLRDGIPSHGRQ